MLNSPLVPLIWITRTLPQALVTEHQLKARGFHCLADPLLEVIDLEPDIDIGVYDDLIITSINALNAFCHKFVRRDLKVWAVGSASTKAAEKAGFTEIYNAEGNGADLLLLLAEKASRTSRFLYAAPEDPARDLITPLNTLGINVDSYSFYRTLPKEPKLFLETPDVITHILLYSPRAARLSAAYIHKSPKAKILCLSDIVKSALFEGLNLNTGNLPFDRLMIDVASQPNEAMLFELIV
jgi:uroporphyrinogen-III synthase